MKIISYQWNVIEKVKGLKSTDPKEDWKVTYATPVYGGWDLVIECIFNTLEELDKIVSFCRSDEELSQWIEETTTFISTKKNFTY